MSNLDESHIYKNRIAFLPQRQEKISLKASKQK